MATKVVGKHVFGPDQSGEGVRWMYSSAYGHAGTAAKTVGVEVRGVADLRELPLE